MKKNIIWFVVSCLMAISLVMASCGPTQTEEEEEKATSEEPQYGGILREWGEVVGSVWPGRGGQTRDYDYTLETLGGGNWALGPAGTNEWPWDELMGNPPDKMKVGFLAESWERPDATTIIFHIRHGVHFHDIPPVNGRELEAADVVYSWERFKVHPKSRITAAKKVESVTATDKYTVVFKLNTVEKLLLNEIGWGMGTIIPREIVGMEEDLQRFNIGTGPFIMKEYIEGSTTTYERNPNYWMKDPLHPENQIPYVDGVILLDIPEEATRLASLRTHKIDMLGNITWRDGEALQKTNPELNYRKILTSEQRPLVLFDVNNPPFDDINVRKAMCMAIDRAAIADDYYQGNGIVYAWPLLPKGDMYVPFDDLPASTKEQFNYDPDTAKTLLDEAGYPAGFKVKLIGQDWMAERYEILASYWGEIDVEIDVELVDRPTFYSLSNSHNLEPGSIACMPCGAGNPGNISMFESTSVSNSYVATDLVLDDMINDAKQTMDEAEWTRKWKDASVYLLDKHWAFTFPLENIYYFWQPWLMNYHGEVTLYGSYGAIASLVWLDLDKKEAMTGER